MPLLHGFAASTFSWREVLPSLAQWGRTVAFDRPAFGLTERPLPETWQGNWTTQNPYTLDAQVDLTLGVTDQSVSTRPCWSVTPRVAPSPC